MIGETVSHYRIIEKLGSGGMGEVFLAEDTKLDRRVALKFLPSQLASDEEFQARFTREAQAAAKLNHPNIITIYEVSEHDDRPYFAMEHVEGRSLREIIASEELSTDQAVDIMMQICQGLQAAHNAGIVHRDIKPSNILMDKDGRCRILDFGLAAIQTEEKLTKSGSSIGTVHYMSPEQVQGEKVDHRSDIFSLGVVLYEMITGRLPFRGDYDAAVVYSMINDTPEPLTRYKSDVSDELQRIIDKALEKDRETRYQHIDDLLADAKKLTDKPKTDIEVEQIPSIAVMPLKDMSPHKDQEYFCDGITEEIINTLTQLENLRIAARTSAFSFKGKDIDIREIGRKLNVSTLLDGSVRKSGNRLRITVQLVNVADGYHIWSERYDNDLEDVFAVQDEISMAIVNNLKVRLLGDEKAKLVNRNAIDTEIYKVYLMGIYFLRRTSEDNLKKAIGFFDDVISRAPDYAAAYAGLSVAYATQGFLDFLPPWEIFPKSKAMALKAIEIDSKSAEGHSSLGIAKMYYDWDWEGGERELRLALEINPHYVRAQIDYATYFMAIGKLDQAIWQIKKILERDPLAITAIDYLGILLLRSGQLIEAEQQFRQAIELESNFSHSHWLLGQACVLQSKYDEGLRAIQKALDISQNNPMILGGMGWAYAVSGRDDEARHIIGELRNRRRKEYIRPYAVAKIYCALGEKDLAFEWLDKAYEEHDISLSTAFSDETISSLHSDARFVKLLNRMGLVK
jgi:serine/threonine protein kinase/Tfp pilus assembly protein PilF